MFSTQFEVVHGGGKVWQQEQEVAVTPAVRKQNEECSYPDRFLPFIPSSVTQIECHLTVLP